MMPQRRKRAVGRAERHAAFHASTVDALVAEEERAQQAHVLSYAEAHKGVFEAGAKLRIAACERADAARAALAEAAADYARGTAMLGLARANGWRAQQNDTGYPRPYPAREPELRLPAPEEERGYWEGRR